MYISQCNMSSAARQSKVQKKVRTEGAKSVLKMRKQLSGWLYPGVLRHNMTFIYNGRVSTCV